MEYIKAAFYLLLLVNKTGYALFHFDGGTQLCLVSN